MKRRVVVTGLGLISPIGNTFQSAWKALLEGQSGITRISRFDAAGFASQIAGEVKGFNIETYLSPKEARRMDVFIHYGLAAAIQAVRDAGILDAQIPLERIGVNIGSGIGGLSLIENTYQVLESSGPRKISPFFIPGALSNMIAGNLSILFNFQGPNYGIVSACTTATHSIGDATRCIQYGDADVMVAGGAEAVICPLAVGGFSAARALSTRNNEPETASRPWDKGRDGFVLGEGAGVLVLEEYERARARGAKLYAEIVGFGMGADAYHMTSPAPNGEGAARSMRNALADAALPNEAVDYINAHGTSTVAGDIAETQAVKAALGPAAYQVAMSSTKSATGHLLGAAGGIEAIFGVLAIRDQIAPPTLNLVEVDAECDLDYIPQVARPMKIDVVLSNSFGFGGTNGTLVFRRI